MDAYRFFRNGALIFAGLGLAILVAQWVTEHFESSPEFITLTTPHPASAPIALIPKDKREVVPLVTFVDGDGHAGGFAQYVGHPFLVNFWATWCGPCQAEMPALDALRARLGPDFPVLTISLDTGGAAVVQKYLAANKLKSLPVLVAGPGPGTPERLPTSLLVDAAGNVAWRGEGARDWTSPDVAAAIAELRQP